jgi:hypothetical protein
VQKSEILVFLTVRAKQPPVSSLDTSNACVSHRLCKIATVSFSRYKIRTPNSEEPNLRFTRTQKESSQDHNATAGLENQKHPPEMAKDEPKGETFRNISTERGSASTIQETVRKNQQFDKGSRRIETSQEPTTRKATQTKRR